MELGKKKYLARLCLAITLLLLSAFTEARAADFVSSQTGNWSSSSTWGGAGVPGAADNVTVSAGHTVNGDTGACTNLAINGTLNIVGGVAITATGNLTNNGTLSGIGSFLNFNGNNVVNNGSVTVATFRFNAAGAKTVSGNGTWTGSSLQINNNASVTLAGDVTFATTNFAVDSTGGGTLNLGGFILTLSGVSFTKNANGNVTGSGTFRTQGTSSMSVNSAGTFDVALEVNSGTTAANNSTFAGSVTINSGATLTALGGNAFTVTGDLTNNGTLSGVGAFLNFNGAGSLINNNSISISNFRFNNAGAKTVSGSGTWTSSSLQINNNASVTLMSNFTLATASFSVGATGSGTLDPNGFILTLSGVNFSNGAGGSVTGSGTFRTQGTTSIAITGLSFNGALEVNSGTTTVNIGTFAGSVAINSGATLSVPGGAVITANGDLINNGTLSGVGAFFNFNGAGSLVNNNSISISNFRFNNAGAKTVSGSGTWTSSSLQINNSASVTLMSNVTLATASFNVGATGSGTLDPNGSILTLSGVNFSNGAGGSVTGSGTFRTQGTTSIAITGLSFNGALEVNSGTTTVNTGTFAGSVTINSGATLSVPLGSIVSVNGNLTNNGTLSGGGASSTFDFNGTGTDAVNNGLITVAIFRFNAVGAKTLSGTESFSATNVVQVNNTANVTLMSDHQLRALTVDAVGGGTFDITNRTLSLSGAGTPMTVGATGTLTTTGSTIVYNGAAAQTVQTTRVDYINLTNNNAAGVSLTAAETVPATLTLLNGVFTIGSNLTMGNASLIRRSAGSLSGTPTFGASINVEYFGSNPITSGTELPLSSTVLNNLTMNNSNTVTLGNVRTVNATLFLNTGVFSNGANLTMVNGTAIQRDAGSLSAAPSFGATANVSYTGPSAVTTGPEVPSAAAVLNNLTINKAGGVNLGGNATVNGTLALSTGLLDVGSNTLVLNNGSSVTSGGLTSGVAGTVNYNPSSNGQNVLAVSYGNLIFSNFNKVLPAATINIAGTFTTGTAVGHTITGNTINFNGGGSQTIPAFNYNNLTSSNTGARTLQSTGTIRVASVFTSGGNSYTLAGSTVEYNGVIAQTLPASFTPYNNLTINNPAGVNGSGVAGLTVNALLRVQAGTFTSASTYNVVQIDSGATLAVTPGSTINVLGNWTNNGSFTPSTGTINLNGSAAQVINGSSATVFNNLTINNAAGATLSSGSTVNGTLTLTDGVLTNGTNLTIGNAANIKRDTGSLSAAPTFGASVNVEYLGAGAVSTGPEIPAIATVLNNLTDNKAGTGTLGSNATVNGTLALNTGTLAVDTNTLTINSGTSVASGALTSAATGTVDYNQSSNGQNVLAADYGNLTLSDFSKTLPSSGTVKIAGLFTTGAAGGHTLTGSTIEFNGAGARSMPPGFSTYNNLTINCSSVVSLGASASVDGTFTRTSGSLSIGANTLTLNGAINATTGLNGGASSNLVIGGSAANASLPAILLNNLTVNRPAGITLAGPLDVNGLLTLTNGIITATVGNPVTIAASGSVNRSSGYIIGDHRKDFSGAASFSYHVGTPNGYSPVDRHAVPGNRQRRLVQRPRR